MAGLPPHHTIFVRACMIHPRERGLEYKPALAPLFARALLLSGMLRSPSRPRRGSHPSPYLVLRGDGILGAEVERHGRYAWV